MKARSGFTLVEILIVVVILGILAAIVIPQFTEASTEAKTSSLMSDLQTVRSQIELYKIQHGDALPGDTDADGAINSGDAFKTALTTASGGYGPYLQKFPSNPFATNGDTVTAVASNVATAATTNGWWVNQDDGYFGAYSDPNL